LVAIVSPSRPPAFVIPCDASFMDARDDARKFLLERRGGVRKMCAR
jgi:hypothetical protein